MALVVIRYQHRQTKLAIGRILSVVFLLIFFALSPGGVFALDGCTATTTSDVSYAGSANTVTFVITNNDALASINLIHIQRPSEFFWIGGVSDTAWSVAGDATQLYFTGSNLEPSQSISLDIDFTSDVKNLSAENWIIETSDTEDIDNMVACDGSHASSITGHPDNNADNGVSSVLGTGSGTSATITWNSDYPTSSYVYYGTTSGYGSVSNYDAAQVQDHSITLTGLAQDTGYHFQVAGTDSSGSSVWSADSTFISDGGGSGGGGSGGGGSGGGSGGTPEGSGSSQQPTNNTPVTTLSAFPPIITIDSNLKGPYKAAPTISGSVNAAAAISRVEYSIDNAKNWLPADKVSGLGTAKATYSLTPVNLKDGNYFVVMRATDVTGNYATATSSTFVIDLLPPIVGTASIHIGTQSILPNAQGVYGLVEGTDTKITLSAIGGPTSIYLEAQRNGDTKTSYTFSMKQSADTGLWSGIASFTSAGEYSLQANAVDGAQNKTTRQMGTVVVQSTGATTDVASHKPVPSKVSVYYLDPETNLMMLWDGESTDQINPATTKDDGKYSFYLPAGTYYLRVTSPGYKTVTTDIFHVDQLTNVTSSLQLHKKPSLRIGDKTLTLPWISFKQTKIDLTSQITATTKQQSIQKLPKFSLDLTNGKKLSTADLFAKPTVLSFVSTWSDAGRDQLSLLSLAQSEVVNFVPIASGESLAKLRAYVALGGYTTPVLADVNNQLVQDFSVSIVPTHYFMNRRGAVTRVITGVMTLEELMNNVTN